MSSLSVLGSFIPSSLSTIACGGTTNYPLSAAVLDARGITTANVPQTGDSYAVVSHADYGNAKLVRSTAPANTLSVDATHKVAVPDSQKVDLNSIATDATAATFFKALLSGGLSATVDSATFTPTTSSFEVSGLADVTDDTYKSQCVKFGNATGTALDGKAFFVTGSQGTANNANGKVKLTVETMPIAPSGGDAFVVFGKVAG